MARHRRSPAATARPSPPARGPRRWTETAGGVLTLLRRAPATTAFTALVWIIGAATGSIRFGPGDSVRHLVAVGPQAITFGHWWSPLSSAFWCGNLAGYLA